MGKQALWDEKTRRGACSIALFLAALCLTGWWELFHELSRDILMADTARNSAAIATVFFMKMHCPARAIGMLAGAALALIEARYRSRRFGDSLPLPLLFAVFFALDAAHFFFMNSGLYALGVLLHFLVNALLVYLLLGWIRPLFDDEFAHTAAAVVAFALGVALVNLLIMPITVQHESTFLREAASICLLAIAAISAFVATRMQLPTAKGSKCVDALPDASIPHASHALVGHLLMYGAILGFLHVVGRRTVYGAAFGSSTVLAEEGSIPMGLGSIIAAVIIVVFALRKNHQFPDVWNLVRKAVFTLAVMEFLLLPLISAAIPAVTLGDCASMLYQMLFVIGCRAIYHESDYTALELVGWGILLLSAGQTASSLLLEFSLQNLITDSSLFSLLRVVAFLMCTVATFWVGSDADIRKLWGLRHDFTPKQYRDAVIEQKVAALAAEHKLTRREREILTFVAEDMRADQIADALFISSNTVRTHIKNGYAKLGVHSVGDLKRLLSETSSDV